MSDDAAVGPPRAADADRERTAAVLRDAFGAGMLDTAELAARLDVVYQARTLAQLAAVTGDLSGVSPKAAPGAQAPSPARALVRRRRRFAVGLIGGPTIRGRFRAARQMLLMGVLGAGDIDFTDAEIDPHGVTVISISVFGGGDVYVPDGYEVDMRGISLTGGGSEHGSAAPEVPVSGVVRVRYLAVLGGPDVRHGPMRRRKRGGRGSQLPAQSQSQEPPPD